ncbi:MAG: M48 family metallopeptidase [Pseudanabaenaceae cyanobacterium SKYGB_i_bin29]|nr:M48 family metallopeptidase [Pseudanabaenaceae cyanobacterium SKYG29]MDW8421166.1 M48 family metallopeptidase [Pseudanabaenaceae cyanobacterium SKYGB_i_bin29]
MTRRWLKVAITFTAIFLLSLSVSTQTAQAFSWLDFLLRGVQIIQISNISEQEEVALGGQIDQRIRRQVKISSNAQANELVKTIGAELVPHSDRPQIPYTFQVVEDPEINAFATLGGYVYVNTGTIAAADNRAQLAAVIAHEIGHIAGRHSLEQLKQAAIAEGILTLVGADRNELVRLGTAIGVTLPRSREDEFDADRRGLFNLARAGYAPQAMPKFMEKLGSAATGLVDLNFLSTHPPVPDRIAFLNSLIQEHNLQGSKGLDDASYQQTWRNFPGEARQKRQGGSTLKLRLQ